MFTFRTRFTVFSGDIKKKKKKLWKWPVNWSFSELFYLFFFRPPTLILQKKNPVNQLIKKFWPKLQEHVHLSDWIWL